MCMGAEANRLFCKVARRRKEGRKDDRRANVLQRTRAADKQERTSLCSTDQTEAEQADVGCELRAVGCGLRAGGAIRRPYASNHSSRARRDLRWYHGSRRPGDYDKERLKSMIARAIGAGLCSKRQQVSAVSGDGGCSMFDV